VSGASRKAKRVDVTGDGALERFELSLGAGFETAFQRVGVRRQQ
jgi:hypothetical protein